jgi:acetylornithine deacetylase/succinyl-diaminopimelate desuccinylase-like protein
MRLVLILLAGLPLAAQKDLAELAQRYCTELIRIDTTNPPGNETPAARYVAAEMQKEGIPAEVIGEEPSRLNVVARLKGQGAKRPLLLMAHTDVVPADRSQWSVDPFAGLVRDGFLWGRGAQDDKCLLAAEMAVVVDFKRRAAALDRDIILLGESDEEAGSTGIQWLVAHAWEKIDAEFAINEGGYAFDTDSGTRVFQVQTAEKVPSRVKLIARGSAGHGSLPRADNPVLHLARAITRLTDAEQPVRLNTTTTQYLTRMSTLPEYAWLAPLLQELKSPEKAVKQAARVRAKDPELDAILRTTVSPTMLEAGVKINVIPNIATAQVDVRRLPDETRDELLARFRRIVNDAAVEILPAGGQEMPSTEPSSLTTPLYHAIEETLRRSHANSLVVPFMTRGATDGSYLRQKGMAVYGTPIFVRVDRESRAHGNDERLALQSVREGLDLLRAIVWAAAGNGTGARR